mgnify:CR=1 FL=1
MPETLSFVEETQKKDLLRLATAGSVDDGKSTLIGRLLYESKGIYEDQLESIRSSSGRRGSTQAELDLALVTDGLKAEREQGITIDVAYRYFSTPRRKFIIADTPGHEQYTRNMVTGASTANLAIVLIDARNGVVTQSRRHAFIAALLGIRHIVVAINKMDLVGWSQEVFNKIVDNFTEFSAKLDVPDITFIPISALLGDNVTTPTTHMPWYEGSSLLHHLETVHIASDQNLIDLRFPVQYVSRPNLDFRGYMGTPASGVIRKGDEVMVLPSRMRSRVKQVFGPDGEVQQGFPPMPLTITLEDEIDISRGSTLVHVNNVPRFQNTLEAMVVWMSPDPIVVGKQYLVKHCTNRVPGSVSRIRYRIDINTLHRVPARDLQLNEIGRCELELARPIAFDPYKKNRTTGAFILIDRETHNTVGAGMILDRDVGGEGDGSEGDDRRGIVPVTAAERAQRLRQKPIILSLSGGDPEKLRDLAIALDRTIHDQGGLAYRVPENSGIPLGAAARMLNDAGLIAIVIARSADDQLQLKSASADRLLSVVLGDGHAIGENVLRLTDIAPELMVNQILARLSEAGVL